MMIILVKDLLALFQVWNKILASIYARKFFLKMWIAKRGTKIEIWNIVGTKLYEVISTATADVEVGSPLERQFLIEGGGIGGEGIQKFPQVEGAYNTYIQYMEWV